MEKPIWILLKQSQVSEIITQALQALQIFLQEINTRPHSYLPTYDSTTKGRFYREKLDKPTHDQWHKGSRMLLLRTIKHKIYTHK